MEIWEAIGYKMLNDSDISAIVSADIYHGLRPQSGDPCINYFESGYEPMHNGTIERSHYQISCRGSEPGTVEDLARKVCVLWHNFSGSINDFMVILATVENKMLLPEPDTNLYHVPIDIFFVYDDSTVS